jgi:hypothetical protein
MVSCLAYSTLKMEVTCSSETSADFQQMTCHYIPEDRTLWIYIVCVTKEKRTRHTKLINELLWITLFLIMWAAVHSRSCQSTIQQTSNSCILYSVLFIDSQLILCVNTRNKWTCLQWKLPPHNAKFGNTVYSCFLQAMICDRCTPQPQILVKNITVDKMSYLLFACLELEFFCFLTPNPEFYIYSSIVI